MKIRPLGADFAVAPQIAATDMPAIRAAGYDLIVNNRPDHELPWQPLGADLAAAAHAAGLGYAAIPIAGAGPSAADISQLAELIAGRQRILGFCLSGGRSAMLWALAQAQAGAAPESILAQTQAAGFDLGMLRPALVKLAASN